MNSSFSYRTSTSISPRKFALAMIIGGVISFVGSYRGFYAWNPTLFRVHTILGLNIKILSETRPDGVCNYKESINGEGILICNNSLYDIEGSRGNSTRYIIKDIQVSYFGILNPFSGTAYRGYKNKETTTYKDEDGKESSSVQDFLVPDIPIPLDINQG